MFLIFKHNMSETVRRLQKANKKKKPFNSRGFDREASKSISKNHTNEEILNRNFETWCENNQKHLIKMYAISGLSVDFNMFCNYVYKNSEK